MEVDPPLLFRSPRDTATEMEDEAPSLSPLAKVFERDSQLLRVLDLINSLRGVDKRLAVLEEQASKGPSPTDVADSTGLKGEIRPRTG